MLQIQLPDIINELREIIIRPFNGITLIETSKQIYYSNDNLQFRIITLNDWLKPIDQVFQQIIVQNEKSNTVMRWDDVRTKGFLSLQMPIASDNVMGTWKIIAISSDNRITEQVFRVQDQYGII